jgi:prevent-host-death family protein
MQTVQQIVPISDFRIDQDAVLKMMDKEPVILAQRSKARAVLVSVDQWNTMVKQLAERRFTEVEMRAIAKAYQKRAEGMEYETMDDLKARMAERDRVTGKA